MHMGPGLAVWRHEQTQQNRLWQHEICCVAVQTAVRDCMWQCKQTQQDLVCGSMRLYVAVQTGLSLWLYKQTQQDRLWQYATWYVAVQTDPAGLSLWQYETVYVAVCGSMRLYVAVQTGFSLWLYKHTQQDRPWQYATWYVQYKHTQQDLVYGSTDRPNTI